MPGAYLWAWDEINQKYIKVKVNADGYLEVVMAVTNLDDLADVYVPSPTDGYILYWDATATRWKCKAFAVTAHKTSHQDGGSDEISVTGLSGLLADGQTPLAHKTSHQSGGSDELALAGGQVTSGTIADARIASTIARDTEVTTAISTHTAIAAAHHTKTVDASELTTGALDTARLSTNIKTLTITFIIDGGGSAITTGQKGHLEIPFACTLTAWTLAADVAGAIVIDVWKDTYANFPPTDADAMPGAGKEPTIAATNQKAQDTDISDWTTKAIAAGDILAFNVDSCTTITRVTLSLKATKS
jgi:hypothetical protein